VLSVVTLIAFDCGHSYKSSRRTPEPTTAPTLARTDMGDTIAPSSQLLSDWGVPQLGPCLLHVLQERIGGAIGALVLSLSMFVSVTVGCVCLNRAYSDPHTAGTETEMLYPG
jgi:hypothetical protein